MTRLERIVRLDDRLAAAQALLQRRWQQLLNRRQRVQRLLFPRAKEKQ